MDLGSFLAAIMADWVALMSGIASVLLTIIGIAKKWERIPSWAFWLAATVCFFIASGRVWTTEHRALLQADTKLDQLTKPKFEVVLGPAMAGYDGPKGVTYWLPMVRIINHQAPSAILGWKAHYKSLTLDQDVPPVLIANRLTIPSAAGSFIYDPEDNIAFTRGVIAQGDFRDGRLPIAIPGDKTMELSNGDAAITITVVDYLKQEQSAEFRGKLQEPSILGVFPKEGLTAKPPVGKHEVK